MQAKCPVVQHADCKLTKADKSESSLGVACEQCIVECFEQGFSGTFIVQDSGEPEQKLEDCRDGAVRGNFQILDKLLGEEVVQGDGIEISNVVPYGIQQRRHVLVASRLCL